MGKKFTVKRVKKLDPNTLKVLKYLDKKCFPDDDPYKNWKNTLWWVIWDTKQKPAGFGGGVIWEPDNYLYLSRAGVLPEFRGNNLQKRLIAARHNFSKKKKLEGSYTYTNPENIASNNNLIKSGFEMFQPYYRWAGSEFLYWYKEI